MSTCVVRGNTEKIWEHWHFAKQKRNVLKARKTSAGGLGGAVSPPVGPGQSPQKFLSFFVRNEEKHRFQG